MDIILLVFLFISQLCVYLCCFVCFCDGMSTKTEDSHSDDVADEGTDSDDSEEFDIFIGGKEAESKSGNKTGNQSKAGVSRDARFDEESDKETGKENGDGSEAAGEESIIESDDDFHKETVAAKDIRTKGEFQTDQTTAHEHFDEDSESGSDKYSRYKILNLKVIKILI
nr:uncharacterized protein LOC113800867 [Penaeus vannamei]